MGAHDHLLQKLPIEGLVVNRLILDYRFVLDFGDPPAKTYELALESPFRWWSKGDETGTLTDPSDGAQEPAYLGEAITALHRICTRASSSEEGTLRLEFDNGLRFEIQPTPKYEAWSLAGGNGLSEQPA